MFCRVCKSGTNDQILNGTEQNCDYFVDNLFEEAQKVGAMCVPPTTVKNQVGNEEKNTHVCYKSTPGVFWKTDTRSPAVFSSTSVKKMNAIQRAVGTTSHLPVIQAFGLFGSYCFMVDLESF